MAAQTVVLGLESVDRDGHRVQSRREQSVEPLRRERHAVGDHPPRVFAVVERTADPFQVGAHEHLAAREDDHHAVRIDAGRDLAVEHAEKILGRHVLAVGRGRAVRTAVAAPEVAAQRTLPEERAQFVPLHRLAVKPAVEFQPQPFTQRKMSSVHATPLRFSPRVRRRRPSARNARTSNFPRPGPVALRKGDLDLLPGEIAAAGRAVRVGEGQHGRHVKHISVGFERVGSPRIGANGRRIGAPGRSPHFDARDRRPRGVGHTPLDRVLGIGGTVHVLLRFIAPRESEQGEQQHP